MYILNITINMEESIHNECLVWLKHSLKIFLSENNLPTQFNALKVKSEAIQNGITYSLQFYLPNKESILEFEGLYDQKIASALFSNYKEKVLDFRTTLEVINWNN